MSLTDHQASPLDDDMELNDLLEFYDVNKQPSLKRAIKAWAAKQADDARVEAYQHILLSDNGMQEPLKSWLEKYLAALQQGENNG